MHNITLTKDVIEAAGEMAGLYEDEGTLRFDYSGRGMYGNTAFGIVGTEGDLIRFIFYLQLSVESDDEAEIHEMVLDLANSVRTDGMGLDTIFYFPHVEVLTESEVDA